MNFCKKREIATLTFRTNQEWIQRFGRTKISSSQNVSLLPTFNIESYLNHIGKKFAKRFDPNSSLYLSKVNNNKNIMTHHFFYFFLFKIQAIDLFDITEGYDDEIEALSKIKCPVQVIGVTSDRLYPIEMQRDLARQLKKSGNKNVSFLEIDSIYGTLNLDNFFSFIFNFKNVKISGHDSFLLNINDFGNPIKVFFGLHF